MLYLTETWHFAVPILLTAIEIAGIASAWHAIRNVRSSQAAVAWSVALFAMPALVLPGYWVFGRNRFNGYRDAIREVQKRHRHSVAAAHHELLTDRNQATSASDAPLEQVADALDTPVCHDNRFKLLIDGNQFFTEIQTQIQTAKEYVYAEFYEVGDDETGRRFADGLCRAAQRGVTVRLLYDEIGSHQMTRSLLTKLRHSGVDVQSFNTRQGWWNRLQLNFRNHRKLLVVDGNACIVGGLNIADLYDSRIAAMSPWRDTAILATGPIARKVQAVFASDYYWARRADLPEANWTQSAGDSGKHSLQVDENSSSGSAAIFATGPADQRSRGSIMFMAAIASAQKRLWISTPYLVPDEPTMVALSMLCAKGADVRIIIPAHADHWLVYLASFHYELELANIGVKVQRYKEGFLHQKCVLVDDQLAMIGSTNLDNRSLYLNFEVMLATNDPETVKEVRQMLEEDFNRSKLDDEQGGALRPWYQRVGTVLARLFSPIL